jgi:Protein of unknown function (DUF3768)
MGRTIRELNDVFRKSLVGGRVAATARAASRSDFSEILDRVRSFGEFTEGNDPYGERDFGAFKHRGERFFWKIDYYNRDLTAGSPDPSDANVTCRVLTIMFAEEY